MNSRYSWLTECSPHPVAANLEVPNWNSSVDLLFRIGAQYVQDIPALHLVIQRSSAGMAARAPKRLPLIRFPDRRAPPPKKGELSRDSGGLQGRLESPRRRAAGGRVPLRGQRKDAPARDCSYMACCWERKAKSWREGRGRETERDPAVPRPRGCERGFPHTGPSFKAQTWPALRLLMFLYLWCCSRCTSRCEKELREQVSHLQGSQLLSCLTTARSPLLVAQLPRALRQEQARTLEAISSSRHRARHQSLLGALRQFNPSGLPSRKLSWRESW